MANFEPDLDMLCASDSYEQFRTSHDSRVRIEIGTDAAKRWADAQGFIWTPEWVFGSGDVPWEEWGTSVNEVAQIIGDDPQYQQDAERLVQTTPSEAEYASLKAQCGTASTLGAISQFGDFAARLDPVADTSGTRLGTVPPQIPLDLLASATRSMEKTMGEQYPATTNGNGNGTWWDTTKKGFQAAPTLVQVSAGVGVASLGWLAYDYFFGGKKKKKGRRRKRR